MGSLATVNVTYLIGGFFFSLGGYSSILLVVNGSGDPEPPARTAALVELPAWSRAWRSAVVLFVGTLFFAVSLVAAFAEGLTPRQSNGWIWLPDILGCVCFLVSGHLAMLEVGDGHVRVRAHVLGWWVVAVNQLGSVLFFLAGYRGLHASGDLQRDQHRARQLGNVRRRGLLRGRAGSSRLRHTHSDKNGGATTP